MQTQIYGESHCFERGKELFFFLMGIENFKQEALSDLPVHKKKSATVILQVC